MTTLAERLRGIRTKMGLKQSELAAQSGVSERAYQGYEAGKSVPGGDAIEGFMKVGISANWLLTGEGSMLLADLQAPAAPAAPPGALDIARMRLSIEAVEEGLAAASRTMTPNKKAELIMAVYDLLEEPGVNKNRVLNLVKLAA